MTLEIRPVRKSDESALWVILEPIIRAGETYPLPRDMSREAALSYWCAPTHTTFVACDVDGTVLGTYYIRPNQQGGGAHVCNCGYAVAANATGKGVARAMCQHSMEYARNQDFKAMQFNFVIASNTRAIGLWEHLGFNTIGRLPDVYDHPSLGYVDALVMFQKLQ